MFERTIQIINDGIRAGIHLGAQIYVMRDFNILLDEAVGLARPGEAMTRDHLMLWMSAGKPVTAVAIGQLLDRGLLSLDDRVTKFIPEFGVNGKDAITIRHLLTHTAGFRGPLNNFTPGTWDEIISRVCALKQEPNWVPGQKAGYHIGSSWFILGELIRRIDGRRVDEYLSDEIFVKISQRDAHVGMTEAQMQSYGSLLAPLFDSSKGAMDENLPHNSTDGILTPRPGANARGPIRALGEFYRHLLSNDERLISRNLCAQFTSPQRVGMFDETFKMKLDWGFGFLLDSKHHNPTHPYGYGPHASPRTFGHSGNQCSCAFADPDHGLVVAWACNGLPGELKHQQRQFEINRAIYEDLSIN